jgi:hypothetical protein
MSCGLEVGDVLILRDNLWCDPPHVGDGFLQVMKVSLEYNLHSFSFVFHLT